MRIFVYFLLHLLAAAFVCRLYFFYRHAEQILNAGFAEILQAFLLGFRFDLSAILTFSIPFVLLLLIDLVVPIAQKFRNRLFKSCLYFCLAVNIPLVWMNIVDTELYGFTGRRFSTDWFDLASDLKAQSLPILWQHRYIVAASLFISVLWLWFLLSRVPSSKPVKRPIFVRGFYATLWLGIFILGFRGGWQLKPLVSSDAFSLPSAPLGQLALNSTYVLFKTPKTLKLPVYTEFSTEQMLALLDRNGPPLPPQSLPKEVRAVFLIIVESLASEHVGIYSNKSCCTPFLDQLAKKSLTFLNSYANGRRSIDAIASLLVGIPSFLEAPLSVSSYASNKMIGLPQYLKQKNFKSYFFHGARNGSMNFDSFARRVGFDHYYGLNEYKGNDKDFDGTWGVYDRPFSQFILSELDKEKDPFFATFFTLTSHNPFALPAEEDAKFPTEKHPYLRTLRYVDDVLREFFAEVEKKPWYQNSLFIITGDHTSLSFDKRFEKDYGWFKVPIILHAPLLTPRLDAKTPAQHTDILPTVLDATRTPAFERNFFGTSLLQPPSSRHFVLNNEQAEWWYLDATHTETTRENPSAKLRAYRQYAAMGARENAWYFPAKETEGKN